MGHYIAPSYSWLSTRASQARNVEFESPRGDFGIRIGSRIKLEMKENRHFLRLHNMQV